MDIEDRKRPVKVYWKKRPAAEILDVGSASCQYRVDGDPKIRELRVAVNRKKQLAVIVLDDIEHKIPLEVLRILCGMDLAD